MSNHPRLYRLHVPAADLGAAVDAFKSGDTPGGGLTYLYLESEATIDLTTYRTPQPTWLHGRAFGPSLEIRWQRVGDGFDLLLLTETDLSLPPGWQAVAADSGVSARPDSADPLSHLLLWGTHVSHLERSHRLAGGEGDAWVETRIPRPLHYPVTGVPKWVKAQVIVYRWQGRPLLTRLVSLEGGEYEPQPLW